MQFNKVVLLKQFGSLHMKLLRYPGRSMRDHRSDGGGSRSRRNSHDEGVAAELHGASLKLLMPTARSPRPGDRAPSPQMRSNDYILFATVL